MKKIKLIALLMAFMLCTFAGCGSNTDNTSGGGKTEDKEITIWITTVNQPDYFMGYFKQAFEAKNEGITLNFVPSTNLGSGLDVLLASKGAPDMVATSGGLVVPILKEGGRIENLDSIMSPIEDTFHDVALLNQIDGEFWCAPIFGFASPVIYYNKTVFEQNGWTAPTSYAELVTLCDNVKTVKDSNNKQKSKCISP